jgi:hypothetical protein
MVSVILTLKNRAHLLKWGLEGLLQLDNHHLITEVNIADGGSTDDLDKVIEEYSKHFTINKYTINRNDSSYNHVYNCPALEYNFLVNVSTNKVILKIDPEFTFITSGFLLRSVELLKTVPYAFIMPFPYHTYEFKINNIEDIKNKYREYYYQTHLTEQGVNNGYCRLVYYGCCFNKEHYINLGGIDMGFVEGIGSEDDHFLDQWQKKYGNHSVLSTTEEKGVHLWHGEWGKSVPSHLNFLVSKNRQLREQLNSSYPNKGEFTTINFPKYKLTTYENIQ